MSPKIRAFFFGGSLGVLAILVVQGFHVISPLLRAVLWPGAFISAPYQGESPWTTGVLVGILEFALNFFIYGLVALCIAWLITIASRPRH